MTNSRKIRLGDVFIDAFKGFGRSFYILIPISLLAAALAFAPNWLVSNFRHVFEQIIQDYSLMNILTTLGYLVPVFILLMLLIVFINLFRVNIAAGAINKKLSFKSALSLSAERWSSYIFTFLLYTLYMAISYLLFVFIISMVLSITTLSGVITVSALMKTVDSAAHLNFSTAGVVVMTIIGVIVFSVFILFLTMGFFLPQTIALKKLSYHKTLKSSLKIFWKAPFKSLLLVLISLINMAAATWILSFYPLNIINVLIVAGAYSIMTSFLLMPNTSLYISINEKGAIDSIPSVKPEKKDAIEPVIEAESTDEDITAEKAEKESIINENDEEIEKEEIVIEKPHEKENILSEILVSAEEAIIEEVEEEEAKEEEREAAEEAVKEEIVKAEKAAETIGDKKTDDNDIDVNEDEIEQNLIENDLDIDDNNSDSIGEIDVKEL